jgi:hypothetical protein
MLRFNLKTVLVGMLFTCVYLAFAQTAGYWVMLGIVAAAFGLIWAVRSRLRGAFLLLRLVVGVIGLISIWFLAVDWSWFIEDCPDCLDGRDVAEYRLLGIPVCTDVQERQSTFSFTLGRLGVPCLHLNRDRWHKHRLWGGFVCMCPCFNGISGLVSDEAFIAMVADKMQQGAQNDPRLSQDLYDHVITRHDYKYFWKVYSNLGGKFPDEENNK